MITIINCDLFHVHGGIICHQVNCKGNMGRGVAKTFKELFPETFKRYVWWCDNLEPLGECLFYEENGIRTCCMFAQNDWRGRNVCNTDYHAFRQCCQKIAAYMNALGDTSPIYMPYGIGAGLGGGEWDIIYSIIKEELNNYNVILCKLNN